MSSIVHLLQNLLVTVFMGPVFLNGYSANVPMPTSHLTNVFHLKPNLATYLPGLFKICHGNLIHSTISPPWVYFMFLCQMYQVYSGD